MDALTKTLNVPQVHAKVGRKPLSCHPAAWCKFRSPWRGPSKLNVAFHVQILIDTIDAAAAVPEHFVQRAGAYSSASRVDIYAVALYLFAQLYIRQAQRADAMDVWPSSQPFATSAAVTVSVICNHA